MNKNLLLEYISIVSNTSSMYIKIKGNYLLFSIHYNLNAKYLLYSEKEYYYE